MTHMPTKWTSIPWTLQSLQVSTSRIQYMKSVCLFVQLGNIITNVHYYGCSCVCHPGRREADSRRTLGERQHAARRASLPHSVTEGSRLAAAQGGRSRGGSLFCILQGASMSVAIVNCTLPHLIAFPHIPTYSRMSVAIVNCTLPHIPCPTYSHMLHSHIFPHVASPHIPTCCIHAEIRKQAIIRSTWWGWRPCQTNSCYAFAWQRRQRRS